MKSNSYTCQEISVWFSLLIQTTQNWFLWWKVLTFSKLPPAWGLFNVQEKHTQTHYLQYGYFFAVFLSKLFVCGIAWSEELHTVQHHIHLHTYQPFPLPTVHDRCTAHTFHFLLLSRIDNQIYWTSIKPVITGCKSLPNTLSSSSNWNHSNFQLNWTPLLHFTHSQSSVLLCTLDCALL